MYYLTRSDVCDKLRLPRRLSYEYIGPSSGPRISSDSVLKLLNMARRGIEEPLRWIPDDLMTPEEASATLALSRITPHELKLWTKRAKNVVPHFRLSKRLVLFSYAVLTAWLEERSKVGRLRVRCA